MHTSAHLTSTAVRGAGRQVRALLVGLLAVVAALVGTLVAPTTAHAATDTAAVSSTFDTQVLAATNAVRRSHGLRPLRALSCPDRFASSWTRTLASRDAFYHQSLSPILKSCGLRGAGENLAWRGGSLSASQVVSMWMKSPGHRRNILNAKFRYLGVDAWRSTDTDRVYAGQVFGA